MSSSSEEDQSLRPFLQSEKAAADSASAPRETTTTCRRVANTLRKDLVLLFTVVGIVVGFTIGLAIRPANPSKDVLMWIGMPGDLYLRVLRLIIIPLIAASIIAGTASSDPKSNGKISGIALAYINVTNLLGCVLGVVLGLTVRPGQSVGGGDVQTRQLTTALQTQDIIADLIRNIFPDNMFRATIQKAQTEYVEKVAADNSTSLERSLGYADAPNLLGIIFIALVFGIAAGFAREKGKPFVLFFTSLTDVIMIVINWFMWTSPLGIASLIASTVGAVRDLRDAFLRLGVLIGSVIGGCAFHQLIILPLIIFVVARVNPYRIIFKAAKPWVVGVATTSQAVSAPAIFETCDKLGVDKKVSSITVPLAVTLNRDGSALFVTISTLFLAQINGVALNHGQTVLVGVLTWVMALALPAVPSASLVTIIIVCSSLSLPSNYIGLLFAVEWIQTTPVGVASLIASTVGGISDLRDAFLRLGILIATHVGGNAVHQLIVVPLVVLLAVRSNPYRVIFRAVKPVLVALSTQSSAVTMPAVFECADRLGVSKRVSSITVPLGVTLNRDGSALFIVLVCFFFAQMANVVLNVGQIVLLTVLTWVFCMALPAVPSASLITIIILCNVLAVPSDGVGLFFAVDWFQDRVRTSTNILSTTMCAFVTNHLTSKRVSSPQDAKISEGWTGEELQLRTRDVEDEQV